MQVRFLIGLVMVLLFSFGNIGYAHETDLKSKLQDCHIILNLSGDFGTNLELGDGIDVSNLKHPIRMLNSPFRLTSATEKYAKASESKTFQFIDLNYQSVLNSNDEETLLNTNIGGVFNQLFGLDSEVSKGKTIHQKKYSVYYLFTAVSEERQLPADNLDWTKNSDVLHNMNNLADNQRISTQFVNQFGTHYVGSIKYGVRIAIRVQMNENSESKKKKLALAIKDSLTATFNGKFDSTAARLLKNEDLNVSIKVLSGGMGSAKVPTYLTSLDDIAVFFKAINQTNEFPLQPGILSVTLYPYTNTIPQSYTNISDAMSSLEITIPDNPQIIYSQTRRSGNAAN